MDGAKDDIARLTKLTLSNSRKGGELDPKLEATLEKKEHALIALQKAHAELQTSCDAKLMLEGAKLQILKIEDEIARLADALR